MALTSKDYKEVIEIINLIYSISERSAMILSVLEELQKLISFNNAVFILMDFKTHNFQPEGHILLNHSHKAVFSFDRYRIQQGLPIPVSCFLRAWYVSGLAGGPYWCNRSSPSKAG